MFDEPRKIKHSPTAYMQLNPLLCPLLAFGLALHAAEPATPDKRLELTLDQCLQMALEQNLDLQIERYNPQLSLRNLDISRAGYDPDFNISGVHSYSLTGGTGFDANTGQPKLGSETDANTFSSGIRGLLPYSGMTYNLSGNIRESFGQSSSIPFDNTTGSVGITMTQPLLKNFWIDGTRLNIAVSKNRLHFSEMALRRQIMNVVTSVALAYYDLIFARESVKVQEKALQLADQLLLENKKRVEVGALAPLDEKQAQSQVAARRADLLSARRTLAVAQNALKKLVSDEYSTIHDAIVDPAESLTATMQSFNLQDSWLKGMTQRPDLLQARLDVERDGIQLRYYRNQLFPELDLIGSYGRGASGITTKEFSDGFENFRAGNRPFYTYGAQLSIPLGNRAARNKYESGKLSAEQTLLTLKKLEQDIMVQIDDAVKLAQTNFERVDATKQARLYAEAALDAEQKKLQSGKSTSFVVLQLQRDLTSARSEEIRALADYNKALAQLAQTEGSTLELRNIDLNLK